jgi:hypothetical protein
MSWEIWFHPRGTEEDLNFCVMFRCVCWLVVDRRFRTSCCHFRVWIIQEYLEDRDKNFRRNVSNSLLKNTAQLPKPLTFNNLKISSETSLIIYQRKRLNVLKIELWTIFQTNISSETSLILYQRKRRNVQKIELSTTFQTIISSETSLILYQRKRRNVQKNWTFNNLSDKNFFRNVVNSLSEEKAQRPQKLKFQQPFRMWVIHFYFIVNKIILRIKISELS